jgi:NAD(P)H-quinone oxidoreductase subunit 5
MTPENPWSVPLSALALGIPVTFAVAALTVSRTRPLRFAGLATGVALALAAAVLAGALSMPAGAATSATGLAASAARFVRVDPVTGVMSMLIAVLALVIVPYSRRYLHGDPRLHRHGRALMAVLASVSTLVVTNDLAIIALAWMATSLGLHALLTFHCDRPQSIIVAHKKFLLSRLADVCLIGAVALLALGVGSLDLEVIAAWVRAHDGLPPSAQVAAVLVVMAVVLKSAQLPFHGWLIQVMEAPTPVSALLHAGVVNIGGFVLLRLAPLVDQAPLAQALLVGIGMVTAIAASLVVTTRVSIKVALAWSTCAQMGFMLVQCGLGAWHLALLHLVAHSLYKAHAFASAGTTVERWRAKHLAPAEVPVSLPQIGLAAVVAVTVVASLAAIVGAAQVALGGAADPTLMPLMLLLGVSLAPIVARVGAAGPRALGSLALRTAGLALLYLGWHVAFAGVLPHASALAVGPWAFVVLGFALLFAVQVALQVRPHGPLARALHPWLFAGFYLDEIVTRPLFRAWPPPTPNSPRPSTPRLPEILEARP